MPYHKVEEQLRERLAGITLGSDRILGTTGRGIGPCYADKASRDTALRVADLFDEDQLRDRLGHIVMLKNATLSGLAAAAGAEYRPLVVEEIQTLCRDWTQPIRPFVCDTSSFLNDAMRNGSRVLFEGAHAGLLD